MSHVACCCWRWSSSAVVRRIKVWSDAGTWAVPTSTFARTVLPSTPLRRRQGTKDGTITMIPRIQARSELELQEINSNQRPLSLEFLVTFLTPDRVRFDSRNGGRNPSTLASRVEETPAVIDCAELDSRGTSPVTPCGGTTATCQTRLANENTLQTVWQPNSVTVRDPRYRLGRVSRERRLECLWKDRRSARSRSCETAGDSRACTVSGRTAQDLFRPTC